MSGAFSGDEGKETPIGFTVFLPSAPRQAMPRPRRPNVGQVCPTYACCPDGGSIPIEERDGDELRVIQGVEKT
jgi:hypothetical protein